MVIRGSTNGETAPKIHGIGRNMGDPRFAAPTETRMIRLRAANDRQLTLALVRLKRRLVHAIRNPAPEAVASRTAASNSWRWNWARSALCLQNHPVQLVFVRELDRFV
eukprot:CAMPEP_0202065860 /NCGR_PEP_ID=MMETSP0963-20130614/52576_1 /ASSEMBLY_ACC=CAM_ASM_000494 /TAXON_ID=4773 /ORGANISM="Schizochytrium aggregatum, Strain ATCC28209" /LENGTH=107 /DNA_ID=CAMNT_0048632497 /DNA_START=169 /DNA_END=489 /DNA_ORIENTATION=+